MLSSKNKSLFTIILLIFSATLLLASCSHYCTYGHSEITKSPTCTEPGEETVYCDGCGEVYYTGKIFPSGHTGNDEGICVNCHALLLDFFSNGDGTCRISQATNTLSGKIEIPSKSPSGDTVTEISCSAFENCNKITEVTIPDSVTQIGEYAFSGCSALTSVTIPDSVKTIAERTFSGCESLASITIPMDMINITGINEFPRLFGYFGNDVPESLKSVVITGGGTIKDYAFQGCSFIESITIPDGIAQIGNSAFFGCSSLTSINIPDSVTQIGSSAFYDCSALSSVTIPKGITGIANGAFSGCSSLTSINIPDSVTQIGSSAFSDCSALTSVTVPNSITQIGDDAFRRCSALTSITIPDSVTQIGEGAFSDCSALTSINIPNIVTNIGRSTFSGCSALTSVTIPDSVTQIGDWAFFGCSSLTSINIPDSVTQIGDDAFRRCSALTSINIPDSVTQIGEGAFSDCSALTSITIPFAGSTLKGNDKTHFGYLFGASDPYYNAEYVPESLKSVVITGGGTIKDYAFQGCSFIESITIPDGVAQIGNCAFYGCSSLTSINIPDSVISIGYRAFSGCSSLTSINIPDSVTQIGEGVFSDCSALTSVTISDSVTRIEKGTFSGCSSLTSITVPPSVTEIGEGAFSGCSSLTSITIPFVGSTLNGNDKTHFSYLFGANSPNYNADEYVPESLKTVVVTNSEVIDTKAFYGCSNITSITIQNGTTKIGDGAFQRCFALASVTIPDSITQIGNSAFSGCSSLASITLPKSITQIGSNAFNNCSAIVSITIPSNVESIGTDAFIGCKIAEVINLSSLEISAGSDSHGKVASRAIEVHKGESKIDISDGYVFYNYNDVNYFVKNLNSSNATLPENYKGGTYGIGAYAFYNNDDLKAITIPNTVTHIGTYAFYGCDSLEKLSLTDVKNIEANAFYGCTKLKHVELGSALTNIGYGTFRNCSSLQYISLPFVGSSKYSGGYFSYIFGADTYSSSSSYVPNTLKTVVITASSSIADYAFYGCSYVSEFVLPVGIKNIGAYAFYGCSAFSEIEIPYSVTSIGTSAFSGCSKLKKIEIPYTVTSIGLSAFSGCSALAEISLPFVGATGNTVEKYWFGYIFGAPSYNENATSIPASLKKVDIQGSSSIASFAFYGCNKITEISIPDSVKNIGVCAFSGCASLNTLTVPFVGGSKTENTYIQYVFGTSNSDLPSSLKNVIVNGGTEANFMGAKHIENITLPESMENLQLGSCESLKSLHLGKNVKDVYIDTLCISITEITVDSENTRYKSIDGNLYNKSGDQLLFYSPAKTATMFIIPEGVTFVSRLLAPNLKELIIPKSVTSISGISASSLTKITVLSENQNYCSINGDLYSADGKTLIRFAQGKDTVEFAYGITTIGSGAFSNSDNITEVIIPDTVKSIGSNAFSSCDKLEKVYIPDSVTDVDGPLFYGSILTVVYCETASAPSGWDYYWYAGSQDQVWGHIE